MIDLIEVTQLIDKYGFTMIGTINALEAMLEVI